MNYLVVVHDVLYSASYLFVLFPRSSFSTRVSRHPSFYSYHSHQKVKKCKQEMATGTFCYLGEKFAFIAEQVTSSEGLREGGQLKLIGKNLALTALMIGKTSGD